MPFLPPPREGHVSVLGLGKSGVAAARLLRARGYDVYASDGGDSEAVRQRASDLAAIGVATEIGGHDLDRISKSSLVVVSPGIPPNAPPIVAAQRAGREIVGEIELALRAAPDLKYIAVTGTNGKTTTTSLIGHILRALGANAPDAGNIGTPLADVVGTAPSPEWVSLELSSFQLHDAPSVDPDVGVLTNLSADHLDRYDSVESYFADKAELFRNATAASKWVLNADDAASLVIAERAAGEKFYFSLVREADAWYQRRDDTLQVMDEPLMPRADLQLLGDHNVANALAATLAVMAADAEFRTPQARVAMAAALSDFRALSHRLELVGEWNGVQWINDSKATNVGSTAVAVAGMTRPTVLLLGGRHKGEPYTALAGPIRAHVKHIVAFGEAGAEVEHDLGGVVPLDRVDGTFEDVMQRAAALAEPGDVVLLSPACSSYDMFNNYIERGERFRSLAGRT